MSKYRKKTFDNLKEDKKRKILDVAIKEFASYGYYGTNIKNIAAKAGISTGAIYRYYNSKEDLYFDIMNIGYQLLEGMLMPILVGEGDIYEKIESILRGCIQLSHSNPELNQLYLDCTTEGLANLNEEYNRKMETLSSNIYRTLVKSAQKSGSVNPELDESFVAFFLDNIFIMMNMSYSTTFYIRRRRIYLQEDLDTTKSRDQEELLVKNMMELIRKALSQP